MRVTGQRPPLGRRFSHAIGQPNCRRAVPRAGWALFRFASLAAPLCGEEDEGAASSVAMIDDGQPGSQALSAARFHQYQHKYWQWLSSQFPGYFASFREYSRARAAQRHFASRGIMESGPRFSVAAPVLMPAGMSGRGCAGCHAVSAPPLSQNLDR